VQVEYLWGAPSEHCLGLAPRGRAWLLGSLGATLTPCLLRCEWRVQVEYLRTDVCYSPRLIYLEHPARGTRASPSVQNTSVPHRTILYDMLL